MEFPTGLLGSCLRAFDDLLSSVRHFREAKYVQTYVVGVTFGSLIVQIAPKAPENAGERVSQQLFMAEFLQDLVSVDLNGSGQLLAGRKSRAAYKRFLNTMAEGPEQLTVNLLSSDRSKHQSVVLTREMASEALARLSESTSVSGERRLSLEARVTETDLLPQSEIAKILPHDLATQGFIVGIFKMIDLEELRFAAYAPQQKTIIRGMISPKAVSLIETVTLNQPYLLLMTRRGRNHLLSSLKPAAHL